MKRRLSDFNPMAVLLALAFIMFAALPVAAHTTDTPPEPVENNTEPVLVVTVDEAGQCHVELATAELAEQMHDARLVNPPNDVGMSIICGTAPEARALTDVEMQRLMTGPTMDELRRACTDIGATTAFPHWATDDRHQVEAENQPEYGPVQANDAGEVRDAGEVGNNNGATASSVHAMDTEPLRTAENWPEANHGPNAVDGGGWGATHAPTC